MDSIYFIVGILCFNIADILNNQYYTQKLVDATMSITNV